MKRLTAVALAACLAGPPTAAQRVLIVGPGGQFATINAAVEAAVPGDVVLVQAGTYPSFGVSKGITVVALGTVILTTPVHYPAITVNSLPAGERLVIKGPFGGQLVPFVFQTGSNAGHIHFESSPGSVFINDSASVTLRNVRTSGVTVTNSSLVMTQCQVSGAGPTAAVAVTGSQVVLAESTVSGRPFFAGVPAVALNGGRLTVAGAADTVLTAWSNGAPVAAIAIQAGDLVLAPTVTLVPAAGGPPVQGGNVTTRAVPSLRADLAPGTLSCRVHAAGAQFALTLLSTPRAPVPTSIGDLWVEPWAILVDVAAIPGTGLHGFSLPVPALPPGVTVALQAFCVGPAGNGLSVPAVVSLD